MTFGTENLAAPDRQSSGSTRLSSAVAARNSSYSCWLHIPQNASKSLRCGRWGVRLTPRACSMTECFKMLDSEKDDSRLF